MLHKLLVRGILCAVLLLNLEGLGIAGLGREGWLVEVLKHDRDRGLRIEGSDAFLTEEPVLGL